VEIISAQDQIATHAAGAIAPITPESFCNTRKHGASEEREGTSADCQSPYTHTYTHTCTLMHIHAEGQTDRRAMRTSGGLIRVVWFRYLIRRRTMSCGVF
jgi:hypothetical protein